MCVADWLRWELWSCKIIYMPHMEQLRCLLHDTQVGDYCNKETFSFWLFHKLYLRVGNWSIAAALEVLHFPLFNCFSHCAVQDHLGFLVTHDHLTIQSQIMQFICCEQLFYFLWNLLGGCFLSFPLSFSLSCLLVGLRSFAVCTYDLCDNLLNALAPWYFW